MVDFFLVLMLPNAGDELQGIKRGIMELADALVINKADGESVNLAQQTLIHYKSAFKLLSTDSFWQPQVRTCSAMEKRAINDVWEMICEYQKLANENGAFNGKRARQNKDWMKKLIHEMLEMKLNQHPDVKESLPVLQQAVLENEITPYNAAKKIIDLL
ncbi:MAG: LAO/AO transport system kinase [Bermanella sp.]|jgi:LAO/AO transport system kinase